MATAEQRALARLMHAAAEIIATGQSSAACFAIERAAKAAGYKDRESLLALHDRFEAVFKPTKLERRQYNAGVAFWLAEYGEDIEIRRRRNKNTRLLALCFAAELALTGDL